jgi:hypothetical protein
MTGSFKKIDYSLRPAKHAERRMMCDIFRRLKPFGPVEDYVYVGFGSVWFADFSLFHRALGIRDMLSIEQKESAKDRIEENKPFRIQVDYRKSKDVLPGLDWAKKQFFWLDYDDPLSPDILLDIQTVSRRASSGTVLAASVQCSQAVQVAEAKQDEAPGSPSALARFVDLFGRDRVKADTDEIALYGWPFGALSRTIILSEIEAALAARNSAGTGASMLFHKICEIEYADDARMTTIVGIFYSADDSARLDACNFKSLDFLQGTSETIRITVPKLTAREFKRLESQVPLRPGEELSLGTVPVSEGRHFAALYRYLPNFAVLEG